MPHWLLFSEKIQNLKLISFLQITNVTKLKTACWFMLIAFNGNFVWFSVLILFRFSYFQWSSYSGNYNAHMHSFNVISWTDKRICVWNESVKVAIGTVVSDKQMFGRITQIVLCLTKESCCGHFGWWVVDPGPFIQCLAAIGSVVLYYMYPSFSILGTMAIRKWMGMPDTILIVWGTYKDQFNKVWSKLAELIQREDFFVIFSKWQR